MSFLGFNKFGLVVLEDTFLEYKQLFVIYGILRKRFKKKCEIKFNVSCVLPFTKKPVSARMGKGKGAWKGFNVFVRSGTIIVEIGNVKKLPLEIVLLNCMQKLPVKTKIVTIKY